MKLGDVDKKVTCGKFRNQRKASKIHSSIDIQQDTDNEEVAKQMGM